MNVRAIVTGASGRMGSMIIRAVRDADDITLVGATEKPGSPHVGLDAGLAARVPPLEVRVVTSLAEAIEARADVVIDFTAAAASLEHARLCAERGIALVVGSTGFSASARAEIAGLSRRMPVVMSPNMSVGVAVLMRLVSEAAKKLGPAYDIEILELHHRHKKDAPSGTALRLAEVASDARGGDPQRDVVYQRHGDVGERGDHELGVQSLRGGDVVGEHTVYFFGEGERLELSHRASSRQNFAVGALRAARWIVGKPPGLYDMQDVLGLR